MLAVDVATGYAPVGERNVCTMSRERDVHDVVLIVDVAAGYAPVLAVDVVAGY